ncbi:hypothetical protein [Halomarina rubra]|uniref:Uncharacterized protein n=1 Tax=Halomarina rubra TaxID=2071873 RepID=A0ABD6B1D7_9EURY|nr:hypothetical protein [Halomarina rubra]
MGLQRVPYTGHPYLGRAVEFTPAPSADGGETDAKPGIVQSCYRIENDLGGVIATRVLVDLGDDQLVDTASDRVVIVE